ncbi:MAG: glycogen debranching enzyme GlgX, partial [Patescibacteria group bacterium]|nr:glycogen debranching enzyme GlgX [Patescibacteria group bacterium]
DVKDIVWLDPSGNVMTDEAWDAGFVRAMGMRLAGDAIDEVDEQGKRLVGDTLLVILNADDNTVDFSFAPQDGGRQWELLVDTAVPASEQTLFTQEDTFSLQARSTAVFRLFAANVDTA